MSIDDILNGIRRAQFRERDDMRAILYAVSSRLAQELGELHEAVERVDDAANACPDYVQSSAGPDSCTRCAGTGEGRSDRTVCLVCRGSGVERRAA